MDRLTSLLIRARALKETTGGVFCLEWNPERGAWIVDREKEFPTEEQAIEYIEGQDNDALIITLDCSRVDPAEVKKRYRWPDPEPEPTPEPEPVKKPSVFQRILQERQRRLAVPKKPPEIFQVKREGISYTCEGKIFRTEEEARDYIRNIARTKNYTIKVEE